MVIVRNRLAALLSRLFFLGGLTAIFVLYFLEMSPAWRAFCFLEVQAGAAYLGFLFFEVIFNIIDMRHGVHGIAAGWKSPLMLLLTGYCFIASILYFSYIMPVHGYLTLRSVLYHVLLILIPLLNWLLFEIKGAVRYFFSFISILYPLLYVIISIFRAVIFPNDPLYTPDVMYIYHFFNPSEFSFRWAIWVSFAIVIAFFFLLITFDNLLSKKWKKNLVDLN